MNKKFLITFFFVFFLLIFFFLLNKETTGKISINYKVDEYKIPVYLKLTDFFERHFEYKYLVKKINFEHGNKKDIILNTSKWLNLNIKKIPKGVDVIDYHPLTIIKRRLGEQDQFNDILSILLVYQDIDSFFIDKFKNINHPLTLFKINGHWSIIDPYYGYYFINKHQNLASIEELKTSEWEIINLKNKEKINSIFLNDYDEIKLFYQKIFNNLQSSKEIDDTHIFERSGRSYTQNPISRLRYEVFKKLKSYKNY